MIKLTDLLKRKPQPVGREIKCDCCDQIIAYLVGDESLMLSPRCYDDYFGNRVSSKQYTQEIQDGVTE